YGQEESFSISALGRRSLCGDEAVERHDFGFDRLPSCGRGSRSVPHRLNTLLEGSEMLESNSTTHVFRFVSLRPPTTVDGSNAIPLADQTFLARSMADMSRAGRRQAAERYVRDEAPKVDAFLASALASELASAVDAVAADGGSIKDLAVKVKPQMEALRA